MLLSFFGYISESVLPVDYMKSQHAMVKEITVAKLKCDRLS